MTFDPIQIDPPPALLDAVRTLMGQDQPTGATPGGNTGSVNPGWTRLTGGLTNQSWHVAGAQDDYVVKLYAQAAQTPLFPNDPDAEFLAMTELQGTGLAPEPLGRVTGSFGDALAYRYSKAHPWAKDPGPVATALGRLHYQPRPKGLRPLCSGSAAIAAQIAMVLSNCQEDLPEIRTMTAQWAASEIDPIGRPVFLHGDPVPGNILVHDNHVMFIDWQCPAQGDPCEDIALFLSPSMQLAYRGHPLSQHEVAECLEAYPDRAIIARYRKLAPLYHLRMAAYALWSWENRRIATRDAIGLELDAARFLHNLTG